MKLLVSLLALLLGGVEIFAADVLAPREPYASYPTIWREAGIQGGIPDTSGWTVTNITGLDTTGTVSCVTLVNAAITAAASNTVLVLPAGTLLLDGTITVGKNNIVLRGAKDASFYSTAAGALAAGCTVFNCVGAGAKVYLGISSSWGSPQALASDYATGSTVLTVASTSAYSVGDMLRVWQQNDTTLPIAGDNPIFRFQGGDYLQGQITRVAAKTSTTLTISPGLHFPLLARLNPAVYRNANTRKSMGLENVVFDNTNRGTGGYSWQLNSVLDSWVRGVLVYNTRATASYLNYCLQCEVRHNWHQDNQTAVTGNPNNAGIKLDTCSSVLVIDNVLVKQFPGVQINGFTPSGVTGGGSSGNVVAYNFAWGGGLTGSLVGMSYTSHDSQATADLFQGNIGVKFELDAYYGSTQQTTVARNWFTGVDVLTGKTDLPIALEINRAARHINIVANLLGYSGQTFSADPAYSTANEATKKLIYRFGFPNTGNAGYTGTAQPSTGDNWTDWGTTAGPNGFQERDLDVYGTMLLRDNFNTQDAAIPAGEALGGATVASSYFESAQPAWWPTSLAWPAFDSHAPVLDIERLPAGYRYVHGADAANSDPGDTTPPTPNTIASFSAYGSYVAKATANTATDAAGNGPVQYRWTVYAQGTSTVIAQSAWTTATSYIFVGLSAATQYDLRQQVRDSLLNTSTESAATTVTTAAAPVVRNAGTRSLSSILP